MLANIENLLSRDSSRNRSHVHLGRCPLLQAYLVPLGRNCKNIWSGLDSKLQAYLVPVIIEFASIFGPNRFFHCNHIWSSPIKYTNQVCDRGNWFSLPTFSMTNFCGPFEPMSSLKPPWGSRHVPVTNDKSFERSSLFNSATSFQNQII